MKNKKYRGKYKCDFCIFYSDDFDEYQKHMEDTHGKIVEPPTKRTLNKREDREDILIGGQRYGWDKPRNSYEMKDPHTLLTPSQTVHYEKGDGTHHVRCLNCNKWYSFLKDPREKGAYIQCTNCGLNIFKEADTEAIKKYIKKYKLKNVPIKLDMFKKQEKKLPKKKKVIKI